jgi:hypothetical protein
MTVWCANCQHMTRAAQGTSWRYWHCTARPRAQPIQHCTEEPFLTEAPYYRCTDLNPDGLCRHYEERKEDGEC